MESIYIPQILKAPDRKIEIIINDGIAGLNTLTPVRGKLIVRHGGNFFGVNCPSRNHRHFNLRSLLAEL